MIIVFDVFQFFTLALLGLLAGALWAEGALLVPYWKTLKPDEFYRLHPEYAPRLFRFFAPITALAPALALASACLAWYNQAEARWLSSLTALLATSLVFIYFLYFKKTNLAFSRAAIAPVDLPGELNRWHNWHRLRVVICILAFVCSIAVLFWPGYVFLFTGNE